MLRTTVSLIPSQVRHLLMGPKVQHRYHPTSPCPDQSGGRCCIAHLPPTFLAVKIPSCSYLQICASLFPISSHNSLFEINSAFSSEGSFRHGRPDRPSVIPGLLPRHPRLDRGSHATAGSSTISPEISVHSGLTFSTSWFFHSRLKCFICFSLAIACSMEGKTS